MTQPWLCLRLPWPRVSFFSTQVCLHSPSDAEDSTAGRVDSVGHSPFGIAYCLDRAVITKHVSVKRLVWRVGSGARVGQLIRKPSQTLAATFYGPLNEAGYGTNLRVIKKCLAKCERSKVGSKKDTHNCMYTRTICTCACVSRVDKKPPPLYTNVWLR